MGRILIIGAGGVATVAAHKVCQNPEVFTEVMIASRTEKKCIALAEVLNKKYGTQVRTAQVDADSVEQLVALFSDYKPELVLNLALPYQDLTIMEACLQTGCNYMDTANYEPKDEAHFEYSWQWAYRERFEQAGLTALLGCGFDPGVTSIREITQKGLYWENGKYIETEPMEIHKPLTYPGIGPKESYLLHHEEIESLVINYPTIKRARFWMTFGQQYLTYLDVIENIGMARIDEVEYKAPKADGSGEEVVKIVPLQFLKAVLPNPQDLGENYEGETSIGCRIRGMKDGQEHTYYVYNNCSHQAAYEETGMQGVSYTTGVPAMIGAMMFMKGIWKKPGVHNVEEFDPDPFMEQLNKQGLPWHELHDIDLEL